MHTASNILLTRRSIRQYKPLQITDDQLNAILTAGLFAPSAMNEQAWMLGVIQNPNELQKVAQAAMSMTGSADSPFYNAPTLIIVFVQKDAIAPLSDGALCLGNMMNQAKAEGLGSCWIHCVIDLFQTEEGRALKAQWSVPEDYQAVGSCIVGVPDEAPTAKPRAKDTVIMLK